MSIFKRSKSEAILTEPQKLRLQAWQQQAAEPSLNMDWRQLPWVATDLETSGLDIKQDRVLSIGSVAGKGGEIDPCQSFETILQQQTSSSHQNILIHGISGTAQQNGQPSVEALLDYLSFCHGHFHIGFHAEFDRLMLQSACQQLLGITLKQTWLDLAWLAAALCPDHAKTCKSLDDWLAVFGIEVFTRHHAVADAWATGLLWLALQSRLPANCQTGKQVLQLAEQQRSLSQYYGASR